MKQNGPKPTFTDQRCTSCPNYLTKTDVSHEVRRCKQCRLHHPRPTMTRVEREQPLTSQPWWAEAPRESFTALAMGEVPRMRKGRQYYNERFADEGGKRLLKKMRSAL